MLNLLEQEIPDQHQKQCEQVGLASQWTAAAYPASRENKSAIKMFHRFVPSTKIAE